MESFVAISAAAAPMMQINIDTDQIIPALYLGGTDNKGYGAHLFANLRFLKDGSPNPEFILNREPYNHAEILLADRNFGCGSSRERAPKALREFGFRALIAPSFGGIFFNNCFRNGILPVAIPIEKVKELADMVESSNGTERISIDLETRTVSVKGKPFAEFDVPEVFRQMLLLGVDEIDQTLSFDSEIKGYRHQDSLRRPWAYFNGTQSVESLK
jgi:3-isopropylmalate/(R)-2-methylmalate dehydratase small subunit